MMQGLGLCISKRESATLVLGFGLGLGLALGLRLGFGFKFGLASIRVRAWFGVRVSVGVPVRVRGLGLGLKLAPGVSAEVRFIAKVGVRVIARVRGCVRVRVSVGVRVSQTGTWVPPIFADSCLTARQTRLNISSSGTSGVVKCFFKCLVNKPGLQESVCVRVCVCV